MSIREVRREVTATEFRQDIARYFRDAHYRIPTLITNNGDPWALIVHPDTPDPATVLKRMREFADELRGYCSPHGVSATYADRLEAICDEIENGRE